MIKILETIKAGLRAKLDPTSSGDTGVYISRPVLNGQDWHDWAVKWGVPSPLAAADMHVTVLYSATDVKMIPQTVGYTVQTDGWNGGVFCMFGPNSESLVFAWDDYMLWERNLNLQSNGAVTTWPTYRPHMTISNDAGDFKLPDDALADAPRYISLGGEERQNLKVDPDPGDADNDADDEDDDDDDGMLIVIQLAATEATKILNDNLQNPAFNGVDRTALRDIAAQKSITKSVARRIAKTSWAGEALKSMAPAAVARQKALAAQPTKKNRREAEVTIVTKQLSGEVAKKLGSFAKGAEVDDDRRLVYGIASVSTVDGEMIKDSDGDKITTGALEEFLFDLIRGQRAGKFEHEGEASNEIVGGLVFTDDLQKSLGVDLGMEFLLTVTHVPSDSDWAEVKAGKWMHSIAGLMFYEEDDQNG